MNQLFKIIFVGLIGLTLNLTFPSWQVTWLAMPMAYAAVALPLIQTILLLMLLSFFYSSFSLTGYGMWLLPYALGIFSHAVFKKYISLHPKLELILLMGYFILLSWIFDFGPLLWIQGLASQVFWNLITIPKTLLVGILLLPILKKLGLVLISFLPRPRRVLEELALLRVRSSNLRSKKDRRRPFGF